MGAVVYAHPKEIGDPPAINFSDPCLACGLEKWKHTEADHEFSGRTLEELMEPERAWERQLAQWCRDNGQGELAGEEVAWPRGDGYARYLVYQEKPLALIFIPTGDAWQIEEMMLRGMRLADVRENVLRRKAIRELFRSKGEEER